MEGQTRQQSVPTPLSDNPPRTTQCQLHKTPHGPAWALWGSTSESPRSQRTWPRSPRHAGLRPAAACAPATVTCGGAAH
eukprot:15479250-Alexandrium_andersonii.AAC.1